MKRVLLVLDDEEEIGVLFQRFLRRQFDAVHVRRSAEEAERVLRSEPVTHLVADYFLGPGQPFGPAMIARWRQQVKGIRFAAIFTGAVIAVGQTIDGVDEVFVKPNGFDALIARLRQPDPE